MAQVFLKRSAIFFRQEIVNQSWKPVQRTVSPIGDLSRNYAYFAKLIAF